MIKKISDQDASKILENSVKFKFHVAKEILDNIPTKVPDNRTGYEYLKFEADCESFVYFLCGTQDTVLRIISEKLLDQYLFTKALRNILSDLKNSKNVKGNNQLAKDIVKLIEDYFPNPKLNLKKIDESTRTQIIDDGLLEKYGIIVESDSLVDIKNGRNYGLIPFPISELDIPKKDGYYQLSWNIEDSILTIVREIRNEISHNRIQMSMGKSENKKTDGSVKNNSLVFWVKNKNKPFTSQDFNDKKHLAYSYREFEVENPHEFFLLAYDKTSKFLAEIQNKIGFN